jgi:hypothetical protein
VTTGTKIALTTAVLGVIFSTLAGEFSGVAWAAVCGIWIWLYGKLERDHKDLQTGRTSRPGEYRVTVRPETFQDVIELISSQPPPPSPDHYSVGGTNPHMCICGKPLKEHR